MMKVKHKDYTTMTTRELAEATREFDRESPVAPGKPLTRAQRAKFETARRRGRPTTGEGVQVISLSMEKSLLRKADAAAQKAGKSRAQLVADALRVILRKSA
ncbi:MAG TPA: hypothetical protein VGN88_06365 [Phycisphaerae bacterium]|jgi:hypothetical protein